MRDSAAITLHLHWLYSTSSSVKEMSCPLALARPTREFKSN